MWFHRVRRRRHLRTVLAALLFVMAELVLFGAAEGIQKWQWIEAGTVPIALLALGFAVR